ncbi:acyltransferase [Mangrovimonas xylaniphaga]|uniref:acyltransferase n=1 Tax=Mangrovimonas xylaniphaga TaxID=1645915 RepID=UPI0012F84E5D|nr:acyltransferase [Mangrovimonas xylaniphaga]
MPLIFKLDLKSSIQINENVNFAGKSKLLALDGGVLKIGQGTFVNTNCSFNALDEVKIGENCLFGESVKIYDHNHRFNVKGQLLKEQNYSLGKVTIGNNTWVGSNVVILKGVTIGNNVVIGAGCVLNMDIPNDTLVTLHKGEIKLSEIKFK